MSRNFLYLSIIAIFLFLVTTEFQFSKIKGSGMTPNLNDGQFALLRRNNNHNYRSQIVTYQKDGNTHIGRIIALPHESVRVENGYIYLKKEDGIWRLTEDFLPKYQETQAIPTAQWVDLWSDVYLILPDYRPNKIIIDSYIVKQSEISKYLIYPTKQ